MGVEIKVTVLQKFQEKFKVNEYKIYETEHWIWSLRPHQATVGSGVLSLKRECATFGELKPEEFSDLNNIIKITEATLKSTFNYDVINYLMLMMIDKHVHYHVLPRYEKEVKVLEETWKDESWPAIPLLAGEILLDEKLQEITALIKFNIEKK